MDFKQRTIHKEVSCTGIGLHSGRKIDLIIKPAPADYGIRFIRKDLSTRSVVEACFGNVVDTRLCTTLGQNGTRVSTVEHLMAAFFGLGIDNARVELEGPEVPIMDGSAAPFVYLLRSAEISEQKAPKRFVIIQKPFEVREEGRSVQVRPSKELKISYTIDFTHPLLRDQHFELHFSGKDFIQEISRARTFGFLKDIQMLRENGLALGGSLDNAIVIDDFRVLNEDGLRYRDEFVRHKILDFLGDLAILGRPVIGHFVVRKSGHALNQAVLKSLTARKNSWQEVTFRSPEECLEKSIKLPVFLPLEPALA
ncbi:MAG: UDP-3-O-acyl-N-acetylglucosamine deacetylase [Deltaproteobacteria bacterium]|nr:UDP-3-O-acyl-N-acetylglucosamine deacetylase [Deltaproteobacteria bacterium]